MTNERFQQIKAQGGVLNLSARAKFRLTGADRVRYLNGQVTQDVRGVGYSEARYGLITDHKARILTDLFFHADGNDGIIIDAEPGTRELLGARLERYIIADDVELTDVTEEWDLWHFFGAAIQLTVSKLTCSRVGEPGVDLWLPADEASVDWESLLLTEAEHETLRIMRQLPRWPSELNTEVFPAEAVLEASAVSFNKGCYIGQEIISRIKLTGKMPRTLVGWESDGAPVAGQALHSAEDPGKTVGIITSVAADPGTGVARGLAYVRQGHDAVDSALLATGEPPTLATTIRLLGRSI